MYLRIWLFSERECRYVCFPLLHSTIIEWSKFTHQIIHVRHTNTINWKNDLPPFFVQPLKLEFRFYPTPNHISPVTSLWILMFILPVAIGILIVHAQLNLYENVYLFSKDLDFFDVKLFRFLDLVILSKHMCLYILISWDVTIV